MSLIKIKPGVIVSQQVVIACALVNAATTLNLPVDMLITSGRDGKHKPESLHYRDRALDARTKHLTLAQKYALRDAVAERLGAQYDVILEDVGKANEHLHMEMND